MILKMVVVHAGSRKAQRMATPMAAVTFRSIYHRARSVRASHASSASAKPIASMPVVAHGLRNVTWVGKRSAGRRGSIKRSLMIALRSTIGLPRLALAIRWPVRAGSRLAKVAHAACRSPDTAMRSRRARVFAASSVTTRRFGTRSTRAGGAKCSTTRTMARAKRGMRRHSQNIAPSRWLLLNIAQSAHANHLRHSQSRLPGNIRGLISPGKAEKLEPKELAGYLRLKGAVFDGDGAMRKQLNGYREGVIKRQKRKLMPDGAQGRCDIGTCAALQLATPSLAVHAHPTHLCV